MPKYYIESGRVRLVLDAETAEQAAIRAFQWSSDRQAEVYAEPPSELIREAEASEFQLDDEITVNETGFGNDAETFDMLDIAVLWEGDAFIWHQEPSKSPRKCNRCPAPYESPLEKSSLSTAGCSRNRNRTH